jgi:hypothetical protein
VAFINLYTKKTANPKDIDFPAIGVRVKEKIPAAAVRAFLAKVPRPQAKPFDFNFDKDTGNGKLQITVKQLGFVYGWVDAAPAENKAKMKSVEDEIEAWRTHIQGSIDALAALRERMNRLAQKVDTAEHAVAAKEATRELFDANQATRKEIEKLLEDGQKLRNETLQFWSGEPGKGVTPLIKKHGLQVEELGGAKEEAYASYALLQQAFNKWSQQFILLGKEVEALNKLAETVSGKLFTSGGMKVDRQTEREEHEAEIQKTIGAIQGYKNSDFSGTGAAALVKAAREFTAKSGAAWTRLSANPTEIDKTATQVGEVIARLRILGGRVNSEYTAWQKGVATTGQMPRFQKMLKMVYDEYMDEHTNVQTALQGYKTALQKQKPKALELIAKAAKAQAKADAKAAKKRK